MEPTSQAPEMTASSGLIGPGALIKNAWRVFMDNWKVLAGIAAVPVVIRLAGFLLALTVIGLPLTVLLFIAAFVATIAMVPALVDAVHKISLGAREGLNLKTQYRFGFSLFWSFLGLIILESLAVGGATVLFFIPGIIVGVYVSMYVFARVIDGHRGFAALTESYALIRNRWMTVFATAFIIGLVFGLAVIIVSVIFAILGIVGPLLANIVISIVIMPMVIIAMHGLYMGLKRTRAEHIETAGFKKWLIAFIVVGIVAVAVLPIIIASAYNYIKAKYLIPAEFNAEIRQMQLRNGYTIPTQASQQ